jgi:hypothetical protein
MKTTFEAISVEKRWGILDGYNRGDETRKEIERLGTTTMGTTEA